MGATSCPRGLSRRGFLLGTGVGLAAGLPLGWLGLEYLTPLRREIESRSSNRSVEVGNPSFAMPGRYPGRVVEVHDRASVADDHVIRRESVRQMMPRHN